MLVTLHARRDIQDCRRVRRILDRLAEEYDLQVTEVQDGRPKADSLPAIEIEGSRLGVLDSSTGTLSEATVRSYLQLAAASGAGKGHKSPSGAHESEVVRREGPQLGYRVKSYLWKHRVGAVVSALGAFLGLAYIAPLLAALGMKDLYSAIFSVYRLVCVQTPERSPIVTGHQCCLCWRCVGIYGGSLLMGILYTVGRDGRLPSMSWLTRPVGLGGLIIFGLPMIIDGLSHMLGLRAGPAYAYSPDFWLGWQEWQFDWWVRMATALLATVGATRFLCPRLDKIAHSYETRTTTSPQLSPARA